MTSLRSIQTIAIIGGGPCGLMAADILSSRGYAVSVYDQKPSLGRKFLMAGRGGLNLTHSEDMDSFLSRYSGSCAGLIRGAVLSFTPAQLRQWCEGLGQETFVGSSGRVFPKALKASPLLRAWLIKIGQKGVTLHLQHSWQGWNQHGDLSFLGPDGRERSVKTDMCLLALGGASWPALGSDGQWQSILRAKDISIASLRPSNCGFFCEWSSYFKEKFSGMPLKGIQLSHGGQSVRGEIMMTQNGIEGGAVYALSSIIRTTIETTGSAEIKIDLRPAMTMRDIASKLSANRGRQSFSTYLQKTLNLSPAGIALLRETHAAPQTLSPDDLAALIKSVPLNLTAPFDLARAISTAGGISRNSIDDHFRLHGPDNVFAAGEMLDWEAPTGGYLLQACFASGRAAALEMIERIEKSK